MNVIKKTGMAVYKNLFAPAMQMNNEKIKLAIVGCGSHATDNIYPSLRYAPIELCAVCARHKEKAMLTARQFGAPAAYDNWEEMLDKETLDAVAVIVNPELHYRIAMTALQRHLHVFLEKPPTTTYPEAEKLLETMRTSNRIVAVGLNKRYQPAILKIKKLIEQPSFGPITQVVGKFGVGPMISDRNVLMEIGIHFIDLLYFLLGEFYSINIEKYKKNEAFVISILIRFLNGAVGTFALSEFQSWQGDSEWLEITGTNRYVTLEKGIRVKYFRSNPVVFGIPLDFRLAARPSLVWEPNFSISSRMNSTHFYLGYVGELTGFATAILKGMEPSNNLSSIMSTLQYLDIIDNMPPPSGRWVKSDTKENR